VVNTQTAGRKRCVAGIGLIRQQVGMTGSVAQQITIRMRRHPYKHELSISFHPVQTA
jgi:hypothetical protein